MISTMRENSREPQLQSAEAAWLDDAQDAETVEVRNGLRHDVAGGVGRSRTRSASTGTSARACSSSFLLGSERFVHQRFMPRTASHTARVTSSVVALPPRSGVMMPGGADLLHRAHQQLGGGLLAEMLQHHRAGPEAGDRIGDALAGDVERGAVDRLEHRRAAPLGIDVAGGRDAERAGQRRRQIGQDIGVQVGRHHGVDGLRPAAPCAWSSHRPVPCPTSRPG